MYRGDMAVRAMCGHGPVWSWSHELLDYVCAAAYRRTFLGRVHAMLTLRQSPQAVRLQVGASASTCWLTGRRILEVAPYRYNLYSNPHESTAIPFALGIDPLFVRDRTRAFAHAFVERNREHRASIRDRAIGMG